MLDLLKRRNCVGATVSNYYTVVLTVRGCRRVQGWLLAALHGTAVCKLPRCSVLASPPVWELVGRLHRRKYRAVILKKTVKASSQSRLFPERRRERKFWWKSGIKKRKKEKLLLLLLLPFIWKLTKRNMQWRKRERKILINFNCFTILDLDRQCLHVCKCLHATSYVNLIKS